MSLHDINCLFSLTDFTHYLVDELILMKKLSRMATRESIGIITYPEGNDGQ